MLENTQHPIRANHSVCQCLYFFSAITFCNQDTLNNTEGTINAWMLISMYFLVFGYFKTFSVDLGTCVTVLLRLATFANWCYKPMCMYCMCVSVRRPLRYQWTIITLSIFSREHQLCLCSGDLGRGGFPQMKLHPHPLLSSSTPQLKDQPEELWGEGERGLGEEGGTSVCLEGINKRGDIKRRIKKRIERGSLHPLLESVFRKEEKK